MLLRVRRKLAYSEAGALGWDKRVGQAVSQWRAVQLASGKHLGLQRSQCAASERGCGDSPGRHSRVTTTRSVGAALLLALKQLRTLQHCNDSELLRSRQLGKALEALSNGRGMAAGAQDPADLAEEEQLLVLSYSRDAATPQKQEVGAASSPNPVGSQAPHHRRPSTARRPDPTQNHRTWRPRRAALAVVYPGLQVSEAHKGRPLLVQA